MHTMNITNPYPEKLTFSVVSDIEELQIPPEVTLEPFQTLPFYIFAKIARATSQVGFLKFIDEEERFFWYSVALESAEKRVR